MKVAIVTGASRGIGRACALRLAEDGMTVVVNYSHSEAAAAEVVDKIKAAGGDALAVRADVSNPAEVKEMFKTVWKTYGQIDVLVNNAGIVRDEYLLMLTEENLDACLDLNIKGYLYCAQQAVLKMFRKKSGVIINMSSVSSKMALAGQTVYSATKGAVNSMTQTMAKELAPYGIRVNTISPGYIWSCIHEGVMDKTGHDMCLEVVPIKRFGTTDELQGVLLFLASDASSYVTGINIPVDGGYSIY